MTEVALLVLVFWMPVLAGVIGRELDQRARRARRCYAETEVDLSWRGLFVSRVRVDLPSTTRRQCKYEVRALQ